MSSKEEKETRAEEGQSTVAPTEDQYAESVEGAEKSGGGLLVTGFFLDGTECAFQVSDAVEVLKPRAFTDMPRTPDFVVGILSVRGEMIPVIDLKRRLGVGSWAAEHTGRVMVAATGDLKAGFLVDRVSGVEDIPEDALASAAESEDGVPGVFLLGVVELDSRRVLLLDLEKILDFTPLP